MMKTREEERKDECEKEIMLNITVKRKGVNRRRKKVAGWRGGRREGE